MRANVSSGCWWLAEGKQSKSSSTNNTLNLATKNKMSLNFMPTLKREGRVSKGHTEALKPSLLARNWVLIICIFLQVIHPKLLAQAAGTQHYLDGFTTTLKGSEREKKNNNPKLAFTFLSLFPAARAVVSLFTRFEQNNRSHFLLLLFLLICTNFYSNAFLNMPSKLQSIINAITLLRNFP